MSPTPRAAALIALAALAGLVVPPVLSGVAVVSLVAVAALDAWRVRAAPPLERELPHALARGVTAPFAVEGREGAAELRIRQPNVPALAFEPPAGGRAVRGTVLPKLRGRHAVPAPASVTTGPLGLGRWFHSGAGTQEVLVYPDLPNARRIVHRLREGRFREPGYLARGPLGLGTEFESVRDYLPDDDFRQVNWRATARVGRPMTNTYRVEQDRDVLCVVDAGRLMGGPLGPQKTRLDVALDATVAVALVADEVGDRCGALAFDARIVRDLRPRRAGSKRVVEALFDLEATETDSDYELAFRTVGGGKRSLVLMFTDLIDEPAARSLIAATPVLARRHFLVIASATDPDLEELANARPADAVEAARRRVAQEVLDARAGVAARLRRAGAAVVDVPPERLPAACVAEYLRAKARARL
ncbi:MAG TPA: DUF58 domain-containing protein [Actinomycetota bacterium]|nr:DUF58 domain-containing protein [Actinomycetota bacterium]